MTIESCRRRLRLYTSLSSCITLRSLTAKLSKRAPQSQEYSAQATSVARQYWTTTCHFAACQCLGKRPPPRRGAKKLAIIEDGAVLCVGGKIVSAGKTKDALRDPWLKKNRKKITEIDCPGKVVLPGFVDSHTHPVFVSPRLVDFEKRIEGASYEEIAAAGGGIRSSLEDVRKASKPWPRKVLAVLRDMAAHGTTTVEAKSGYGLTIESEIKSLEAIRDASQLAGNCGSDPARRPCRPKRISGLLTKVC